LTILCATSNPGKLAEFRAASGAWRVEPLPDLEAISPCDESGATFEENAAAKARYYGAFAQGWLFAEDSGLEVDALGGAPGVFSARFAGPGASDAANNSLLIEKLRGVARRQARYVAVIALARSGRIVATFRGTVEGRILEAPRGKGGFGYDPLFFYPPYAATLAEVDAERKLAVSHRGAALRAMFQYLSAAGS
jgi:XTP/dITP diphosphohydrolase